MGRLLSKTNTINQISSGLCPCHPRKYLEDFISTPLSACKTESSVNIPTGIRSGCPLGYLFLTIVGQYFGIVPDINSPTILLKLAGISIFSNRANLRVDNCWSMNPRKSRKSVIAERICSNWIAYGISARGLNPSGLSGWGKQACCSVIICLTFQAIS